MSQPVVTNQRFALRGGTAAAWTAANSVLAYKEEGYETDTGRRKVGDGVTAWNALSYLGSAPIQSVNGKTGNVVLSASDVGAGSATAVAANASAITALQSATSRQSRIVTTNTTITTADREVTLDTATAGSTLSATLPDATTCNGTLFTVKILGNGYIASILTVNSQTIEGKATRTMFSDGAATTVYSDGANWRIADLALPGIKHLLYAQSTIKTTGGSLNTGDTLAVTNTTEQQFATNYTFPANSLIPGTTFEFTGRLWYTTPGVTAPSTNSIVRLGGVAVLQTGAISNATGANNFAARFRVQAIVRASGTSGSLEVAGDLNFETSITASTTYNIASNAYTINTTQANTLTLNVQCSANGNSFTLRQFEVTECRPVSAST